MNKILVALVVAILAAGPTAASEKTDVMGTIQRFVDAFNKGDMKSAAALCADQTSIIDDFAPHEWHGVAACSRWGKAYDADAFIRTLVDGKSRRHSFPSPPRDSAAVRLRPPLPRER